jgi:hypothetical protein
MIHMPNRDLVLTCFPLLFSGLSEPPKGGEKERPASRPERVPEKSKGKHVSTGAHLTLEAILL